MLSLGIFADKALLIAVLNRGLEFGSGSPSLVATDISRISLANNLALFVLSTFPMHNIFKFGMPCHLIS